MSKIEVQTDNVEHVSNYDLMEKLTIALHHTIRDDVARRIVELEIEKRKKKGIW